MSLNFCRNRTQRYLWSSLFLATVVACGILIYISCIYRGNIKTSCPNCKGSSGIHSEKFTHEECQKVCFSKECVKAAILLLENNDKSIDPCENFYSFACGKFVGKLGKDESDSVVAGMDRSLKLSLKGILEGLKTPLDSISEKLKVVYDSCMRESSSEVNAIPEALEFLSQLGMEGWPHLEENFKFSPLSFEEIVAKMITYYALIFVNFVPTEDERDSSDARYFTISSRYGVVMDSNVKAYEKLILRILSYFGVGHEEANKTWEDFKSIDSSIIRLSEEALQSKNEEGEDIPSRLFYSCEANRNTSLCGIVNYVVKYMDLTGKYSSDYVYLNSPKFVQNIFPIISNFTDRSVANYLALRFLIIHLNELNSFFRVMFLDYALILQHSRDYQFSMNKWEYCINWLINFMSDPLSKVYGIDSIGTSQMDDINSIFYTVRQMAVDFTHQQLWIEESYREELSNIIANASNGFESLINHTSERASISFEQFQPTNRSFLQNSLLYRKNLFNLSLTEDFASFYTIAPFRPDAYYAGDIVHLTYGVILPPIFRHGLPRLLNLATLTPVLGHEFGHQIWYFFENINEMNISTNIEYKKKKKCVEDQLFEFDAPKIAKKVLGNFTVSESLPDLIAQELVQQIIFKYFEQENGNSAFVLPAVDISTKQLLYISMAQMWCSVRTEEEERYRYETDSHAPLEVRLANIFQNSKGFSEAFGCPLGSIMNPKHKCSFFENSLESKE